MTASAGSRNWPHRGVAASGEGRESDGVCSNSVIE